MQSQQGAGTRTNKTISNCTQIILTALCSSTYFCSTMLKYLAPESCWYSCRLKVAWKLRIVSSHQTNSIIHRCQHTSPYPIVPWITLQTCRGVKGRSGAWFQITWTRRRLSTLCSWGVLFLFDSVMFCYWLIKWAGWKFTRKLSQFQASFNNTSTRTRFYLPLLHHWKSSEA